LGTRRETFPAPRRLSFNVTSKNLLIALLALTTVAAGTFAWQQHYRASVLAAAKTGLTDAERAELQQKIWDAERRAHDLEAELAALRDRAPLPGLVAAPGEPEGGGPGGRGDAAAGLRNRRGGDRGNPMAALMENPEYNQLLTVQQKSMLDGRYAALFKNLKLSPAELEKFKDLLVERQNASRDVMSAARAEGLNGRESRDEIRKLVDQAQAEVDATIQATLGAERFAQYKQYEQTFPQRSLVTQLDQRLGYSGAALSPTQTEQLVQILASSSAAAGNSANGGRAGQNFALGGGMGGGFAPNNFGRTTITDATIAQAQSVLAPSQVAALKQLQAEQQAQRQLMEMMRAQAQNRANPPSGSPGGATGNAGPSAKPSG
jgi:hypothetical protein